MREVEMIPLAVVIPFVGILALQLVGLFIHVGFVNCRWKIHQWPEAVFFVAIRDPKTRNDFWHVVINAILIAMFTVMILIALGKIHA
jgi:hypothetical protein